MTTTRWLPMLTLAACVWPSTDPDPGLDDPPVCPANEIGCSAQVGFEMELYNHTPCLQACQKWAERDLDAAVTFLCAVRKGRSEFVDNIHLLDQLNAKMDPKVSAEVLQSVSRRCSRETRDRLADRIESHFTLDRDWSPVHRAAEKIIQLQGSSPELDELVRAGK